jgi:hypothetical protein
MERHAKIKKIPPILMPEQLAFILWNITYHRIFLKYSFNCLDILCLILVIHNDGTKSNLGYESIYWVGSANPKTNIIRRIINVHCGQHIDLKDSLPHLLIK